MRKKDKSKGIGILLVKLPKTMKPENSFLKGMKRLGKNTSMEVIIMAADVDFLEVEILWKGYEIELEYAKNNKQK